MFRNELNTKNGFNGPLKNGRFDFVFGVQLGLRQTTALIITNTIHCHYSGCILEEEDKEQGGEEGEGGGVDASMHSA